MKRILVEMDDPIFTPGIQRTATLNVTVVPAGIAGTIELYLGVSPTAKVATSGVKNFSSTGSPQNLNFALTMPSAPGVYHVYIDIYVATYLIAAFQGTEDVIIPGASIGPIVWS